MYKKFLNLEPEKRKLIIDAAIKEFAQKGYKNASTNEIVKEAGISKGLLFHYFKSKKGLFLFLYDYSVEVITKEFYEKMCFLDRDFFNMMWQLVWMEYDLYEIHPEMYNFFKATFTVDSSDIKAELDSRVHDLTIEGYDHILKNIDYSKFKDGLDMEKTLNTITWSVLGFINSLGHKPETIFSLDREHFKEVLAKMEEYVEFLKKCFYK